MLFIFVHQAQMTSVVAGLSSFYPVSVNVKDVEQHRVSLFTPLRLSQRAWILHWSLSESDRLGAISIGINNPSEKKEDSTHSLPLPATRLMAWKHCASSFSRMESVLPPV